MCGCLLLCCVCCNDFKCQLTGWLSLLVAFLDPSFDSVISIIVHSIQSVCLSDSRQSRASKRTVLHAVQQLTLQHPFLCCNVQQHHLIFSVLIMHLSKPSIGMPVMKLVQLQASEGEHEITMIFTVIRSRWEARWDAQTII